VRRISIICYRETEYLTSLMLPALLTVFKKRNYPPYEHMRDGNIWTSREDILEYEKALEAEKALEQIMETSADTGGRRATKTPGCGRDAFVTPVPGRAFTISLTTPGSVADVCRSETPRTKKEEETDYTYHEPEAEEHTVTTISKNQKIVNCLMDYIFPKWRELLLIRETRGQSRSAALERFETGMAT
jgi:fanconi-associated nuclease 1